MPSEAGRKNYFLTLGLDAIYNARIATLMNTTPRKDWSPWYLLFIVEFAAVLWPPFYNRIEPRWAGIPFFYWYQLLWVVIAAVLTAIVYFATESARH